MSYADEIFRRSAEARVHSGCDEREAELEAEVERLREERAELLALLREWHDDGQKQIHAAKVNLHGRTRAVLARFHA